jgi:hypothetical protein
VISHRSIDEGQKTPSTQNREDVHTSQVALLHLALLHPTDGDSRGKASDSRPTSRHYAIDTATLRSFRAILRPWCAEIVDMKCSDDDKVAELIKAAERALFAVGVERKLL